MPDHSLDAVYVEPPMSHLAMSLGSIEVHASAERAGQGEVGGCTEVCKQHGCL